MKVKEILDDRPDVEPEAHDVTITRGFLGLTRELRVQRRDGTIMPFGWFPDRIVLEEETQFETEVAIERNSQGLWVNFMDDPGESVPADTLNEAMGIAVGYFGEDPGEITLSRSPEHTRQEGYDPSSPEFRGGIDTGRRYRVEHT